VVALVLSGRFVHRLLPSVLLAVVLGIAYSEATGYDGPTVGSIPFSFPPISLDMPWEELPSLVLPGLIIALVGFVEPSTIARTYAAHDRASWDSNQEFVSRGSANVAAAISGGFPVGGSFSRSALNRTAGARTRSSGAVTGLAVLAFLPFAGSLASLPLAVLSAIVIGAVVSLVRPMPLLRLARLSRRQFLVAFATFTLTLLLAPHVEQAVLLGIGLAVAVHFWRELSLEVPSWTEDDALHLHPRGVLWFGTAPRLEDTFLSLIDRHRDARRLLVHLDGLGRIDITGALALCGLLQSAREAGFTADVIDVRPGWRGLVDNVISKDEDPLGTESASSANRNRD
jgi:sulfate permease, SulP family